MRRLLKSKIHLKQTNRENLFTVYFHNSVWCLKWFHEGLKGLHKTFWCTTKKRENKNFKLFFSLCPGLGREGLRTLSSTYDGAFLQKYLTGYKSYLAGYKSHWIFYRHYVVQFVNYWSMIFHVIQNPDFAKRKLALLFIYLFLLIGKKPRWTLLHKVQNKVAKKC